MLEPDQFDEYFLRLRNLENKLKLIGRFHNLQNTVSHFTGNSDLEKQLSVELRELGEELFKSSSEEVEDTQEPSQPDSPEDETSEISQCDISRDDNLEECDESDPWTLGTRIDSPSRPYPTYWLNGMILLLLFGILIRVWTT